MLSGNFAEMTSSTSFSDLLHAANLRHGTDAFTSPPKEGVLRIFSPFKNLTGSAGFEPANLGTKGQHATPRPPKPLFFLTFSIKARLVLLLSTASRFTQYPPDGNMAGLTCLVTIMLSHPSPIVYYVHVCMSCHLRHILMAISALF